MMLSTYLQHDEIFKKSYRAPSVKYKKEEEKTIKLPPDLFDGLPDIRKTKRVRRSKLQILKDGKVKQKKIRADELKKKIIREYNNFQKPNKQQMQQNPEAMEDEN